MQITITVIGMINQIRSNNCSASRRMKESRSCTRAPASDRTNIGTAHASYEAQWNGRQLTLIVDDISTYGSDTETALISYANYHGGCNLAHWLSLIHI